MKTRIHVVPDPDHEGGWLTLEMTDQEAFEWDRAHYGEAIALQNAELLRGPADGIHITPEQNEG
jgi:hypothetical protein